MKILAIGNGFPHNHIRLPRRKPIMKSGNTNVESGSSEPQVVGSNLEPLSLFTVVQIQYCYVVGFRLSNSL